MNFTFYLLTNTSIASKDFSIFFNAQVWWGGIIDFHHATPLRKVSSVLFILSAAFWEPIQTCWDSRAVQLWWSLCSGSIWPRQLDSRQFAKNHSMENNILNVLLIYLTFFVCFPEAQTIENIVNIGKNMYLFSYFLYFFPNKASANCINVNTHRG